MTTSDSPGSNGAPSGGPFARRGEPRRKAVPGDARRHNRSLVLRTMFHEGPVSRADLARATNLTRVTTSDLAAELLAEGLIEELGTREGSGRVGKPATLLGVVPDARLSLTLDLSDDERFLAALVDLAGKVLDRRVAEPRDAPATPRSSWSTPSAPTSPTPRTGRCWAWASAARASSIPGGWSSRRPTSSGSTATWRRRSASGSTYRSTWPTTPTPPCSASWAWAARPPQPAAREDRPGRGCRPGARRPARRRRPVRGGRDRPRRRRPRRRAVCLRARRVPRDGDRHAPLRRRSRAGEPPGARGGGPQSRRGAGAGYQHLNLRVVVLWGTLDVLDETFRAATLDTIRARTMPAVGDNVDLRLLARGGRRLLGARGARARPGARRDRPGRRRDRELVARSGRTT